MEVRTGRRRRERGDAATVMSVGARLTAAGDAVAVEVLGGGGVTVAMSTAGAHAMPVRFVGVDMGTVTTRMLVGDLPQAWAQGLTRERDGERKNRVRVPSDPAAEPVHAFVYAWNDCDGKRGPRPTARSPRPGGRGRGA